MNKKNKNNSAPFLALLIVICTSFSLEVYGQSAADPDKLLLEVRERCQGMCDMREVTYLRLYQSGRAITELSWNRTSRTFEVSSVDKAQIIELMKSSDFLAAKAEYRPLKMFPDTAIVTKIVYPQNGQEKQVTLINYDPAQDKAQSYYPRSLIKLMARITTIVEKERKRTQ